MAFLKANPAVLGLIGLVYAIFFLMMAMRRPTVALTLILASVPFLWDVSPGGIKFSMAEVNLLLAAPIMLLRGRRLGFPMVLAASLAYIAVMFACTLPHWNQYSLTCFVQTGLYLVLAVMVFAALPSKEEDFRAPLVGFVCTSLIIALAVIVHRSAIDVLSMNKNNNGASLAAGFLVALELTFHERNARRKLLFGGALFLLACALFLSLSRGSWLAAIVGTVVILTLRRQFGLMLKAGFALALFSVVAWQLLPEKSKNYATGLSADNWNIKMRYAMKEFALGNFRQSPIIGVGVGLRKQYDATNLVFSTLAEAGVLGLAALAGMYLMVMYHLWRVARMPRRDSLSFSVVAIAGALMMGKLAHGMVDHYWVRGVLMAAWSSLGMSCWVLKDQRLQRRKQRQAIAAERRRLEEQEWAAAQPGVLAQPALMSAGESHHAGA